MNRRTAATAAAVALLAPATALAATSGSAKLPVVKVTEKGNAISVSPKPKSGANEIDFTTDRKGQPTTTLMLIRLKPGTTPAQAYAGIKPDGSNIGDFGSVHTTADVAKGKVVKIQTVLQPARYIAVDPGDQSGRGPTTDFTVAKAAKPKALPKPDATVKMVDYKFRGPKTIKRGSLVRTVNAGDEEHMAIALKVPKGMTAKQLESQLKKGQDATLQNEIKVQGALTDDVSPGAVNQSRLTLAKGDWVLACFMSNSKGVEHTVLGMESELIVK